MTIAVIPIGTIEIGETVIPFSIAQVDLGIMYMLALGGLSVYGAILGGWASNSKYSLLGGLRASAQMISYELTLILSILVIVALSGSLDLGAIVQAQRDNGLWNVFTPFGALAFVLFTIASFAETNRHPFDFAECEPELVGGFHTEYSAMRFALFFLGEYCAMTVMACLNTTLFFGGPSVPFWANAPWYVGILAFLIKAGFFLFLFIWVRWTLPRFRFDQLMRLGWKVALPIALANLLVVGAWVAFTTKGS
jgi:NADH-quinone oxidoreductase subunit H